MFLTPVRRSPRIAGTPLYETDANLMKWIATNNNSFALTENFDIIAFNEACLKISVSTISQIQIHHTIFYYFESQIVSETLFVFPTSELVTQKLFVFK